MTRLGRRRPGPRARTRRRRQEAIDVYRGEWVPAKVTRVGHSRCAAAPPVPFEIWKTPSGPIFAEPDLDWEAPPSWLSPDGRAARTNGAAYSLRWDVSGDTRVGVRGDQPRQRLDTFTRPSSPSPRRRMNIVYADVDGNIGYAMSRQVAGSRSG